DNIDDYSTQKNGFLAIKNPQYTKEYIEIGNFGDDFIKNDGHIFVLSIGDYQFRKYLKKLNLSYDEYQNKAILVAGDEKFEVDDEETGKTKDKYATEFKYKNGDVIEIYNEENETKSNIKIGYVTKTNPFGGYQMKTYLVVSDSMFNELIPKNNHLTIYYLSSNPDKLQDDIDEVLNGEEYYLSNIEEQAKLMNNLFTLIAIFLYGFIIVITLIGITNIFNTITTNMNLRKQEFAMLKSIGMTSREFSKMIRIESVFIGARSLLFGIPIGIAISYLIYHFMEKDNGFVFKMPISAIVLSIVAVNLLITILMRYSMNKLNKENTIETIRNENI
ncbi:MAG: ABC transporter permease, partial [bacterium]|nr:ABC transporter permease [bacterium]